MSSSASDVEFHDAFEEHVKSDWSLFPNLAPSPSQSLVSPHPIKFYTDLELGKSKAGLEDALRIATQTLCMEFEKEDIKSTRSTKSKGRSVSFTPAEEQEEEDEEDEKEEEKEEKETRIFSEDECTSNSSSDDESDDLENHKVDCSLVIKNLDTGESRKISYEELQTEKELHHFFPFHEDASPALTHTGGGSPLSADGQFVALPTSASATEGSKKVLKRRKRSLIRNALIRRKENKSTHPDGIVSVPVSVKTGDKIPVILPSLVMLQQIQTSNTVPVWSMAFSSDALHFAVGSQDGFVRIYETTTDLQILKNRAKYTLQGHEATVVSVQWGFVGNDVEVLASTALDKTLRIWDGVNGQQLCSVRCSDWPVALAFHPGIPGRILTGNLGSTVQVWNFRSGNNQTAEKNRMEVVEYLKVADLVTALAISPNGKTLAIGNRSGRVSLFDSVSLKFRFEVDCRNRRGRYSKGRKVTGISWSKDSKKLCVSTNDSRIRLIDLNNLSWSKKFKGHTNERYMLRAQFSNDQSFVVCPSENNWVYSWESDWRHETNQLNRINPKKKATNNATESFKSFDELVTSFCVAPPVVCERLQADLERKGLSNAENRENQVDFACVVGSVKGKLRVFSNLKGANFNG